MIRPRLLLLDFDGVISPNSIDLQRGWVKRRLAAEGAIGAGVLDDLARAVSTSVPARVSLDLLSLLYGVTWSAEDLASLEREVTRGLVVDPAYEALVAACRRGGIPVKIVSLASPRFLQALPGFDAQMLCPPGGSKADPATFRRLAATLDAPPGDTLLVDDTPMVLRAAKLAGFQTAIVRGSLYDEQDHAEHASYIDLRCDALVDVLHLVEPPPSGG